MTQKASLVIPEATMLSLSKSLWECSILTEVFVQKTSYPYLTLNYNMYHTDLHKNF